MGTVSGEPWTDEWVERTDHTVADVGGNLDKLQHAADPEQTNCIQDAGRIEDDDAHMDFDHQEIL